MLGLLLWSLFNHKLSFYILLRTWDLR